MLCTLNLDENDPHDNRERYNHNQYKDNKSSSSDTLSSAEFASIRLACGRSDNVGGRDLGRISSWSWICSGPWRVHSWSIILLIRLLSVWLRIGRD